MTHTPYVTSANALELLELFVLVGWLVPIGLCALFVSLVRNVAKTRRALERIADAMELPSRAGGSGVLKL